MVLYLAAYTATGILQRETHCRQSLYGQGAGTELSAEIGTDQETAELRAFVWDGDTQTPYGLPDSLVRRMERDE